jgi:hypothetical protein
MKCGRTTGYTQGESLGMGVFADGPLRCPNGSAAMVAGRISTQGTTLWPVVLVKSSNPRLLFAQPGDSGSAVFVQETQQLCGFVSAILDLPRCQQVICVVCPAEPLFAAYQLQL